MSGKNRAAPISLIYLTSAALLFLLASSSSTTNKADKTRPPLPSSGETTGDAAR